VPVALTAEQVSPTDQSAVLHLKPVFDLREIFR
jgi:hypothetical protein